MGADFVRLGDFVSLVRGTTYKSAELGKAGPVLLGLASINRDGGFRADNLKTYGGASPEKLLLGPGDLYVSLKDVTQSGDLLGAVARVPKDVPAGRLTQDTVKLCLDRDDDWRRYTYWVLRTPEYRAYCRARGIGTTNLSLSREDFLAFEFPTLSDARMRAVSCLEALDAKTALNRRLRSTLDQVARTVYKGWFVDNDDKTLGFSRLDGLTEYIMSGGTPKTTEPLYWGGDIPWFASGETKRTYVVATEKRITAAGVSNSSTRLARAGSTVIASAGQGHTRGQAAYLALDSYVNQSVVAVAADPSAVSDAYLFYDLSRRYAEFRQLSDSHSSRGSLTTRLLADIMIPVPKQEALKAFNELVAPLLKRIVLLERQHSVLDGLRDGLLSTLLSVQLDLTTVYHSDGAGEHSNAADSSDGRMAS